MVQNVRRAYRGQWGAYLQALALLSIVSIAMLVIMSTSGCGGCGIKSSPDTVLSKMLGATFQGQITTDDDEPQPGERVNRNLRGEVLDPPGPGSVSYSWTPPEGSSGFQWDVPPDNPAGPPPFIWSDVDPTAVLGFTFNLPSAADLGFPDYYAKVEETLLTVHSDGTGSAASLETPIYVDPPRSSASSSALKATEPGRLEVEAPGAGEVDAWQTGPWANVYGITLTTSLCQDWLDFLQGDAAFLALRLPLEGPVVPTQSYTIPIAYRGDTTPTLALIDYASLATPVLTVPLALRPERSTVLNNELPAAPEARWFALGLDPQPATCPAGLALPATGWGVDISVWLDLSRLPGNCTGCELQFYYCYEGQDLPAPAGAAQSLAGLAAARVLGPAAGIYSYQGQGLTCLGPEPIVLQEPALAPLQLLGMAQVAITPTESISLHHTLLTQGAASVDLDLASDLQAGWGFYAGDWQAPLVPLQPITLPLYVPGQADLWVIGHVPAGTEDGPYTLVVTASLVTSPETSAWLADLMWSGAWVAPPPAGSEYHLYLPLVLKGQ